MDLSVKREITIPVRDRKLTNLRIDEFLIINLNEEAPDFRGETLDGKQFKLSDHRGRFVLVFFWDSSCGVCASEMPGIARAYEKYRHSGDLLVIGVSLDKDPETVRKYLKRAKASWPQIVGGPGDQNDIARKYHVGGVPATFLIDRQGKVLAKDVRAALLIPTLERHLKAAEERKTDSSETPPADREAPPDKQESLDE